MKLVTYNIHFGLGKDERYDLPRIAAEVRGTDVIALQEVERFWRRSGMVDQVAEFAALLPDYYWIYGPGLDVDPALPMGTGASTIVGGSSATCCFRATPSSAAAITCCRNGER